jgi:hypothetical protein
MMLALSEKLAGKAQSAGQSGPLFKPNNAVSGFFACAPQGRGTKHALRRLMPGRAKASLFPLWYIFHKQRRCLRLLTNPILSRTRWMKNNKK